MSLLRPYQQEAVAAVTDGLRGGGRGQLHAACGSGKTVMGQQAALRLVPGNGVVAVLVPSLALVAQTIASWQAQHPADAPELRVVAVCSDDTVADAPVHIPDLRSPVTTDAALIGKWLQAPAPGLRLIVGTYRSADQLHKALTAAGTQLDLLILDEAHHLTGRVEVPIRRMTDKAFLPAVRRLYMTATPRVDRASASTGKSVSMDDTDLFGPVLYSYPFSRGIAEGYLKDYRLFVVGVRASEARAMLRDAAHDYVDGPGAPSLTMLVAQAALVRAAQKYGTRRAVTFHHRIDAAAEFARTLPRLARSLAPDLPVPVAGHVHGYMHQSLRDRVLADLRNPPEGTWAAVSNARCLGEGVDVPAIDAVLFAHPKSSAVDIVQAVGRALRPHPDSPGPSTVIVPLVVPEEDGEIGDLEPGDYATLWNVVRALRAHDEPLGVELDKTRTNVHWEAQDGTRLPSKITVMLPPGTAEDITSQVELMLVRQTTSPWWEGYGAALQYRQTYGNLDVPLRYSTPTPDGFRLGQWLVKQRLHHRRGWLAEERVTALDKAGIVWDPSDARWQAAYQLAADWYARHGHLDIPSTGAGGARDALGGWILRQRRYWRAGTLSEDRVRKLDAIGMIWEFHSEAWQQKLDALADYQRKYGDTQVPQRYEHDGIRLGAWVSQMRAKYRAGKLPKQRIRDLEQAGMVWQVDRTASQLRALDAATAWHRAHGSLDMPYSTRYQGVALGVWLSRQRKARADGELSAHIEAALSRLGMSWDPPAAQGVQSAQGRPGAIYEELGAGVCSRGTVLPRVRPPARANPVPLRRAAPGRVAQPAARRPPRQPPDSGEGRGVDPNRHAVGTRGTRRRPEIRRQRTQPKLGRDQVRSFMVLRPYQQEIVAAVRDRLPECGVGQIRMACGSGKTLVGQRAAEQLLPPGGTVAVLVPSLALVAQTLASWIRHAERDFDVLAVCSDDTVGDAAVHIEDLPVPVTTSCQDISAWLRRPAAAGMRLVLCTHRSAPCLADAAGATGPLDMVILDEAHHYAGRADFTTRQILQPGRLPSRMRLSMTATPREDLRLHRSNVDGGTVPMVGMDDESVFGPVLGDYPFARGIAEGYLEDYRIAVIGVRDSEARALLAKEGVEYVDTPGGPSLQTVVAQAALARARQQFAIRRVLTFHPRVEAAAEFSRTLAATLAHTAPGEPDSLYSAHVHGAMDTRLRERIIERLRHVPDAWTVLSNARCLGEGVDVPAVDAVLFAHPKKSAVDITQAVGRALRPAPDARGPATIIVPLVVPDQDGEIGDLEPGNYATLWNVVRALRAHDESLGAALDAQRPHHSHTTPRLPEKITVLLPPGTSRNFLDQITLLTVRQTTSIWWEGYLEAERYAQQHHHLLVPARHRTKNGFRLGAWIADRRYERRRGLLSADRIAKLDALGMVWEPGSTAFTRKQIGLASARAFRREYGHLEVPRSHITPNGHRLGDWLKTQRAKHRKGTLDPAQAAALTELGMTWDPDEARWQLRYRAAHAFHAEYGHLDVPHRHTTKDGIKLGAWVLHQRQLRSGIKPGGISDERIAALDALGMRW